MQVRMTAEMLEALRATPEIPDNLSACVDGAAADGDDFTVTMNEDEAMAMEEMCQWYIKKDPSTGELGQKARLFDAIVKRIYAAQDAQ